MGSNPVRHRNAGAVGGMPRLPAVQALGIQCAALLILLAVTFALAWWPGWTLNLALAALLQGCLAAAISRWRRQAAWWQGIQFCFPLALAGAAWLQLPSWFFLAGFLALLILYWNTFRTQVPYYPSTRAVWEAVESLLPRDRAASCIDIGSGFGGLTLHLAARLPQHRFLGIEIAPLPWLVSLLRARLHRSPARFLRGGYETLDFSRFDVVFAYLSPAAMPALWHKAKREMRPGSLLLSYEFTIPGVSADIVQAPGEGLPPLYGWKI